MSQSIEKRIVPGRGISLRDTRYPPIIYMASTLGSYASYGMCVLQTMHTLDIHGVGLLPMDSMVLLSLFAVPSCMQSCICCPPLPWSLSKWRRAHRAITIGSASKTPLCGRARHSQVQYLHISLAPNLTWRPRSCLYCTIQVQYVGSLSQRLVVHPGTISHVPELHI